MTWAMALAIGWGGSARAADAAAPQAVPFQELKGTTLPDPDWQRHVCALAGIACADAAEIAKDPAQAPRLYRAKGDPQGAYYVILPGPQLIQLAYRPAQGWQKQQQWDFSDYQPLQPVEGDGETPPLELYPAFYPLGPRRWGVAIVAGWNEMYSGGGGHWDKADIVEIQPAGRHAAKPRLAGLPFACSKSIRACFSEQDYKDSPHCHEEFEGALRLRFAPSASSPSQWDWIATWKESHWPGNEPASKTTESRVTVRLDAGGEASAAGKKLADKISFCEPAN